MARLDLGFDGNEAGWPKTPGMAKALSIMSGAEEAHRSAAALRDIVRDQDVAMDRLGRALLEAVTKGELEQSRLPGSVILRLDEARSSIRLHDVRK